MKKFISALLATAIFMLPATACKKNDDGLKTVRLNEVTHSIFTRRCMSRSKTDSSKTRG